MSTWESELISSLENYAIEPKKVLYDDEFFKSHLKYRPIYGFIADIIMSQFNPQSVVDFGCGCGFLLERLHQHGVSNILGIEGSEKVEAFWKAELPANLRSKLVVADILNRDYTIEYDLAVCMEVAEHIEARYAADLVTIIARSASKYIWFTAAQPGQGGTGHVNLKPLHYWSNLFEEISDFKPDWELTYNIKQEMLKNHTLCLGFPWFRDNCLVMVK